MGVKGKVIIAVAAVAVAGVAAWLLFRDGGGELEWNTEVIREGSVELNVTATGYVRPVDTVEVGTQVSGEIEHIYVDYNSIVKKGQLLAELDKQTLTEKLNQAMATQESCESALVYAQQCYDRTKQLYEAKAATLADFEQATNTLIQAKSSLTNAETTVREAKVQLSYAEIYAPIDGVVLSRKVQEGQTVAASFETPTMFVIANDLRKMQVEADVDEADIGQVKVGQKVTFTVDAYPTRTFYGEVNQIRLQPKITSSVVTYTVMISASNEEELLYPSMTASVTIVTQREEAAVVPVEAFDFVPDKALTKYVELPGPPADIKGKEPPAELPDGVKTVWVRRDGKISPRPVEVSINNGVNAIIKRGLAVGDTVVLSVREKEKGGRDMPGNNPFMPKPPKRK